jgi:hypothetical protein
MWNAKAEDRVMPWCLRTYYQARYVRFGHRSILSPKSIEFKSQIYTHPRLTVPAREGYDIEWFRGFDMITLTSYQHVENGPPERYCKIIFEGYSRTVYFEKLLDFSDVWDENERKITIPLEQFTQRWNFTEPTTGSGGVMSVLPNGRLRLTAITNPLYSGVMTLNSDFGALAWWITMGFHTGNSILRLGQPIEAEQMTACDICSGGILATGPTLVDMYNDHCTSFFQDPCKLCSDQCKAERQECQTRECLTCEDDPDGLECVECEQRCFDGEWECANERCRPICPDTGACKLCDEQCKIEREECQMQECLTCEDDPDGLECVECEQRCAEGQWECANERCRPICEPGELLGAGVSRNYRSNYLGSTASRAFRGNARGRPLIRNAFYPTAGRRTRF